MAKFVITGPNGKETTHELTGRETRIGRVAPLVDLVVHDGRASRLHAIVRKLQTGYTIIDLNSANGTFVNEKKIAEHLLREGDVVRIGETKMRFESSRTGLLVEQVDTPIPNSKTVMLVNSDAFKVAKSDRLVGPSEIKQLQAKAEILSHMFDLSKALATVFDIEQMPIVLGRSTQATYCITDVRVSRSHARIDWQGSSFSLTDLSYNGTFVRFGAGGQTLSLRRGSCTLHGAGAIGLGGPPSETQAPTVRFEVLHLAEAASPMLMRRGGL